MSFAQPRENQDILTSPASTKKNLSADLVRHTGSWIHSASHGAIDARPKQLHIDDVADTSLNNAREPAGNAAASSSSGGDIAGDQSGQPEMRGVMSTAAHQPEPWNHLQGAQKSANAPMSSSNGHGSSMQAEQGST